MRSGNIVLVGSEAWRASERASEKSGGRRPTSQKEGRRGKKNSSRVDRARNSWKASSEMHLYPARLGRVHFSPLLPPPSPSLSLSFSIGSHQVPFSFNRGLTNARLVSRNHSTSLLVFEERDRVSIPPREKTRAWRVLLFPHLFVFKFRLSLSFFLFPFHAHDFRTKEGSIYRSLL